MHDEILQHRVLILLLMTSVHLEWNLMKPVQVRAMEQLKVINANRLTLRIVCVLPTARWKKALESTSDSQRGKRKTSDVMVPSTSKCSTAGLLQKAELSTKIKPSREDEYCHDDSGLVCKAQRIIRAKMSYNITENQIQMARRHLPKHCR